MRLRYFIIILYSISLIWPFIIYPLELALIAVFLIAYFYDWVFVIPLLFWCFFNSKYVEKNSMSKNFDKNKKHIAIILSTAYISQFNYIKMIPIHANGLFFLVEHLQKQNLAYKIYDRADRQTLEDLVYNPNCYGLYILGHGTRYSLKTSKKDICNYQNFADAPKKEFVIQLHCNNGGGKSLVDYIATDKNKSYAGISTRNIFDNLFYFYVLYTDNKLINKILSKIFNVKSKDEIKIDQLSF